MNSWYHAVSSARKWGGTPEDYLAIHEKIDSSKKIIADARHRALYHHAEGIWLMQEIFGRILEVPVRPKEGGIRIPERILQIPVRLIAEQHVLEDLGRIPSVADYYKNLPLEPWMSGAQRREVSLSHLLGELSDD